MHWYVTFMFPYIKLVFRVLSHPSCRRGSWERGRPKVVLMSLHSRCSPCYSYVFAMYPYVSVWCLSRDRNLTSFAVKGSNLRVI